MRRFVVLRIVSTAILLTGLVAAGLLCSKLISRERAELRSNTETQTRRIAAQLQTGVLAAVEPLERLGRWWLTQGKPADQEDWANDGQLFLSKSPGLRQAFWVDIDGWQLWSAVPGAVPNTRRIRPDERIVREIAALGSGTPPMLSDMFDAPSIGPAFYVCFPVGGRRRKSGYVVGLYDARALVSSIIANNSLREQRITVTAGGRQIYAIGPAAKNTDEKTGAAISLANQVWTVGLDVPLHYFKEFSGLILSVGGVIGALVYSLIMLLALSQRWGSALQVVNSALEGEVERRARVESEVRDLNRELSRRVADFETLLEVIPIGIAVADISENRRIRVNRALAEMLGVPADVSLLAEKLPIHASTDTTSSTLGEEHQIVRADGTVLDVLSFASPVFDENGHVRGVLHACVDISERKSLEQRLQRAERMKSLGAMAAGIAHDFNNLLTGILGQSSLAAECVPSGSKALQHIQASMDATHEASSLIQKVLAFTGNSYHTLRPTNLKETIEALRPSLNSMAAPKATIRLDISSKLPDIMTDASEVAQALENLVMNAVEANAAGEGGIQIRAGRCELSGDEARLTFLQDEFRKGVYVRVQVKDTGAGMSPDVAERAFDPFFSTKFLGRGMGLAEVLGIMRAHNGAVRLDTAPGEGTSVELFFPVR